MLFMVIENFKNKDPRPVGERFQRRGRMLPEGVVYQASWVEPAGGRCFQVMEARNLESLREWTQRWDDIINFEVISVLTSDEFWLKPRG